MLGELGLPMLVVQEGGYRTRTLGANARHFFEGIAATHLASIQKKNAPDREKALPFKPSPQTVPDPAPKK